MSGYHRTVRVMRKHRNAENMQGNEFIRRSAFPYAHTYDPISKTVNLICAGHKIRFFMQKNRWLCDGRMCYGTLLDLGNFLESLTRVTKTAAET